MYVQGLYAILYTLQVNNTKPLYSFIQVQLLLLLLLSVATAIQLGALIKSVSNKGSNKALQFKDVEIIKVYSLKDSKQNTIIATVNLEYIKNKKKDRTLYCYGRFKYDVITTQRRVKRSQLVNKSIVQDGTG